jgi:hypothetical protein
VVQVELVEHLAQVVQVEVVVQREVLELLELVGHLVQVEVVVRVVQLELLVEKVVDYIV